MFSNKNFFKEVIAPFSIIRATDSFEVRLIGYHSDNSKITGINRTLQPGTRLRVEHVAKPVDGFHEGYIRCTFADKEEEERFFQSVFPVESRDSFFAKDNCFDISWNDFNYSFEIEKFFNTDDLDYRNIYHFQLAFEHYYFDPSFPVKIPKHALREINYVKEKEYNMGFLLYKEFVEKAFEISCKALGAYN